MLINTLTRLAIQELQHDDEAGTSEMSLNITPVLFQKEDLWRGNKGTSHASEESNIFGDEKQ